MNPDLKQTKTRLQKWLKNHQTRLDNKYAVMSRHQPGTAYHTRAARAIAAIEERMAEIRQAIQAK